MKPVREELNPVKKEAKKIIGIDLGTTNSLVAVVDSGIPYVVADGSGHRLTPSVVHFSRQGSLLVGEAARRLRAVDPVNTIFSVKRFMGRRHAELRPEELQVPFRVVRGDDGWAEIECAGARVKPEAISAEVIKKLKTDAEQTLGQPVDRAVITVPAYFNDAQRQATKRAGEDAGLVVERVLNEPTAAALAYGLNRLRERSKIAVYDLGGGTFDLSILELNEGVFQVLSTHGDTRLGGDDLDRAISAFLAEAIQQAGGPDVTVDPMLAARVREAAESAKIRLSSEIEIPVLLPFLTPDFSFSMVLARSELEELCQGLIARTKEPCLRALSDAKLQREDLDQVILVGGQTRMPQVRRFVSEIFACAEFEEERGSVRLGTGFHRAKGPLLNTSQNPDEAVALGAAIQAEILSGGYRQVLLLDVTPLSLGLETFGGLMNVLVPRNTTIPVKAGEMFTNAVDQQSSMLIHVFQGERERVCDNWSLGKFELEFERSPRGTVRVGIQFEIDANGILHVLARDTKTGLEKVVDIRSAVDVDDAAVQRMVEESVAHAFDDLRARRWVETKLKAMETRDATRKGMIEFGGELELETISRIESALLLVDAALGEEEGSTQVGPVEKLQAAQAELDSTTQALADLMMERLSMALLERRGLI